MEQLLGRALLAEEIQVLEQIRDMGKPSLQILGGLMEEIHAAGLVRGMTGRAGGAVLNHEGWIPVNLDQGGDLFWKH